MMFQLPFLMLSLAADPTIPADAVALLNFDTSTFAERGSLTVATVAGREPSVARVDAARKTSGAAGRGLRFGGSESFVDLGRPAALRQAKAVSVSAWVRVRSLRDSNYIVSSEDWHEGNTRGFVLRISGDGHAEFTIGNGEWRGASGAKIRTGRWVHIAGTAGEDEVAVWIDGERAGTANAGGGLTPSPFGLTIGRGNYDRTRGFEGEIDEVAIYDRALTEKDIAALHALGKAKKPLPSTDADETLVVWPLSTAEKIGDRVTGLAVARSKPDEAVVVANQVGEIVLARYTSKKLRKPARVRRASKSLERELVPQRLAAAIDARGDVHVFASYLGFLKGHPNFVLHSVVSATGRELREWGLLDESLGVAHSYALPVLTTSTTSTTPTAAAGGELSLLALGRTGDNADVIAMASLSRDGIEKPSTKPVSLVSKQRLGDIGRNVPCLPPGSESPLLLTDHGKDLLWVSAEDQSQTMCLPRVRELLERSQEYVLHVSSKGMAHVACQMAAGDVTLGESSVDLSRLVLASGEPGRELSGVLKTDRLSPRMADIAFAESARGEVYMVAAFTDFDAPFEQPFRLDVWRFAKDGPELLGSAGRIAETFGMRIAAAVVGDELIVAAGGLDGAWVTAWPLPAKGR